MPFPLLLAVPSLVTSITGLLATAGITWQSIKVFDAVEDWFSSGAAWELMSDRLNQKLAAAGLDLQFPPFNPLTDEGRETVKNTIEAFALARINAKTGGEFSSLADLNPDTFLVGVGGLLAKRVNRETGANLSSIWPIDALKKDLQTEAVRQFDNRGRYAGGTLFKAGTIARIRDKIALKHPALMAHVVKVQENGPWGPPLNEAHRKRREKGRARQKKYTQTHRQAWQRKPWVT
jgi:hypothetical protein